jgi:soluble lytic murein transglycosylase-like protein
MRISPLRIGLAAALALAAAAPARAEIRRVRKGEETIVTNLRTSRQMPARSGGSIRPGSRALPSSGSAPEGPPEIADLIQGAASRYGFDPAILWAVVAAESSFDHLAVSKKGARGLMQLMPETARQFGVRDVHDPATNIEAGAAYLRELVARHGGSVTLALAAYNAGPEAVARYGGVPPYEETRRYLERIRRYYGVDLDRGDRSSYHGGIHLSKVERGGVPHFTNLKPRRVVPAPKSAARSAASTGKP